jgi:hypothetical protein
VVYLDSAIKEKSVTKGHVFSYMRCPKQVNPQRKISSCLELGGWGNGSDANEKRVST